MPWEINRPITLEPPPELVSITGSFELLGTNVGAILEIAKDLLEAAKIFYFITADPYKALVAALITELEEFINDTFGAGIYSLIVDPFTAIMHGKRYDRWGIPLVTPGDAINLALASLDDEGDPNRPIFSPNANIAGCGIMLTTPSYGELFNLLQALWNLLQLDYLLFLMQKLDRFKNGRSDRGRMPDWVGFKISDIPIMGRVQSAMLDALATVKGYIVVTDEIITQLLNVLTQKLDDIQYIVDTINILIANIETLVGLNQAVVFDMPKAAGGTDRLRAELQDPVLMSNRINEYTFMILFVGGGPGADKAEILRSLLTLD